MNIKTRLAPSPTGFLHIGSLRTALFNYLFAKKHGGTFAIRVEDTDRERLVEGAVDNILHTLKWAGIHVDEGVVLGEDGNLGQKGNLGSYIQSERLEIYKKYIGTLLEQNDAYYCFCTRERLDTLRAKQEANKQPTGYDGHCRNISGEEGRDRFEKGESCVIRLKMSKEGTTEFDDIIRGHVEFENRLIDDQILMKSDGYPTYHFAVVVDDHLMEITHVIRGEEWISSVPKHVAIYKAFGWDFPIFAHLPLLVNEQKQKLSKRHGDVSVEDFKEKGYIPEALLNFIAFLGWNPGTEQEIFTLKELEKNFDLEKVQKASAVFNREKLDWYNREWMKQMDLNNLTKMCVPFFHNAGVLHEASGVELSKIVAMERERSSTLLEIVENTAFIFADTLVYSAELLVWKKSSLEETKKMLHELSEFLIKIDTDTWTKEGIESVIMPWIEGKGWGNGDVLWPMRVALSGLKNSPSPFEIAGVLGKERTLERIHTAINKL